MLLGQPFDLAWALPPLVYQVAGALLFALFWIPVVGWVLIAVAYLAGSWLGGVGMFANLNRPDVTVGAP